MKFEKWTVCGRICALMDQRTRSIIIGAVALVILVSIVGVIAYLGKASRGKTVTQETNSNSLSNLPVITATTSGESSADNPQNITNTLPSDFKAYQGSGFNLNYSKSWGLLTCNNSQNFELDPTNGVDVKNLACDYAIKPITVLVTSRATCSGDTVRLGNNDVKKTKTTDGSGDTNYRWCLNVGGKGIDITHRVSGSGSRATSKDDFSAQIEQAIGTLQAVAGGS